MKFVTAQDSQGIFVGVMDEGESRVLPLNREETLEECIATEGFFEQAMVRFQESTDEQFINIEEVSLLAPIPRPKKNIFCVGKNYEEHAIEMGSKDDIPEHIMVFTKAPTTVIGPNESVLPHEDITSQLDYEGELAVVIGKKGRKIKKEDALNYVFGYTIVNDVTARDLQAKHKQFFIGKSLDTSCPMGPWIVHSSAIDNPNQLSIETRINDEVRQKSNTENFIFPIEEIISVLSQGLTLEPGDIIATGTPSGVGKGFKPPRFLKAGDKMEVTVEKIGTLVNQIQED
ncbi:fumarylacetoacetate hydrolase family protein [Robertmurraya massiliosenegalensis]|uniref:fumarylacetoacetate hydrolase family protein n=1 Tax=Robertmurraya massiliosenegalensis TaxID=1287657 RepID=UPI00031A583E|nr:fumarylacetoacetate hydrolase family protein [Robertmurraya massiliosenegalensis]